MKFVAIIKLIFDTGEMESVTVFPAEQTRNRVGIVQLGIQWQTQKQTPRFCPGVAELKHPLGLFPWPSAGVVRQFFQSTDDLEPACVISIFFRFGEVFRRE